MAKYVVTSDSHVIEAVCTGFGPEHVKYDGVKVSSKVTVFGGDHVFSKQENGKTVNYDVCFSSGFLSGNVTIRKNGIVIFTSR